MKNVDALLGKVCLVVCLPFLSMLLIVDCNISFLASQIPIT